MKRISLLVGTCLAFSALSCFAGASPLKIGQILKPAGAHAKVNGKVIEASIPLFWGDRLITGPDTTLDVIVYPSFALKLKPSSEVRLIGNLIEKNGERLMATAAVQALKGRLQGHLFRSPSVANDLKVFARRTISSIRGTTFEIAADEDVQVFEGEVAVEDLTSKQEAVVSVTGGEVFAPASPKAVMKAEPAPTDLVAQSLVDSQWKADESAVLSAHAKEAKAYRENLQREVASVSASTRKDAQGMFRSIKGSYDQFKKKK